MARVKCIAMHRDEDVLLEPWLKYHGYLFGFENIFLFDHGSVQPEVVALLDFYEQLGVEIRRDLTTPGDFHGKGQHFANVIRHWDNSEDYDFVFPLDCDEFLALFTTDGVTCARGAIHAYLDGLTERRAAFGFDVGLFNVPDRPGWFFADTSPKGFLARGTVGAIDFGNHAITSVHGGTPTHTNLVYLHQHYRPHDSAVARARRNLASFVDLADADAVRGYTGPGLHLVRQLTMDEDDYLAEFDAKTLVRVPEYSLLLRALGVTDPLLVDAGARREHGHALRPAGFAEPTAPFSAADYVAQHADLQTPDVLPLKHYLPSGHAEGRALDGRPRAARRRTRKRTEVA